MIIFMITLVIVFVIVLEIIRVIMRVILIVIACLFCFFEDDEEWQVGMDFERQVCATVGEALKSRDCLYGAFFENTLQ